MKSIHIPSVTGHSLNKINNEIKKSLCDEFIFTTDINADIFIQHYVASIPNIKYEKTILIQPIDGTIINPVHVKIMNSYDLIIAPSNSSKNIMISCGVKVPIVIIPNYFDDSLINENDSGYFLTNYPEKKYTFYSETTGINRKNSENIVKYFIEEFRNTPEADKVRLIMKFSSGNTRRMKIIQDMASQTGSPEVCIVNSWLNNADIDSLMRGADCYVSLSFMEGFCIPLLNAAVMKKDIISMRTKISGYVDFINDQNAVLLNVKSIPIDAASESLLIYSRKSKWEEPYYSEYKHAMRKLLYGSYKFYKSRNYTEFSKSSVMKMYKLAIESEVVKSIDVKNEECMPQFEFTPFSNSLF